MDDARPEAYLEDLPPATTSQRVVVVGAGMAGLSAAYQLSRAGHHVTVLEARRRPGGRVHTVREPFADDLYAEAGAIFIPTAHRYLMKYVELEGLPLDDIRPREMSNFYHVRGKHVSMDDERATGWPYDLTPEERELGLLGMRERYISSVGDHIGNYWADTWPDADVAAYDQLTMLELMARQGASPEAAELLRVAYHARHGDNGRATSALHMLRNYADSLGGDASSWKTIRGGNDLLPRALARRLGSSVHYGAAVTAIAQDEGGVRVSFERLGRRAVVAADRAVVAVPFPCLRDIHVDPAFSGPKRDVVERMRTTSVAHTYLQMRSRFWMEGRTAAPMGATDLAIGLVRDATFNQPGTRGILDAYSAGGDARSLARMDEVTRAGTVIEQMDEVFPGAAEHVEVAAFTSWDTDPWSKGDYAWFAPGELTRWGADVRRPEGRIHFAGDHTSPWTAWQQGAIHSGHRAAHEIQAAG